MNTNRKSMGTLLASILAVSLVGSTGCKREPEPEPTYQGKTLSQWVVLTHDGNEATRETACETLVAWDKTASEARVHDACTPEIKAVVEAHRRAGPPPRIQRSYFSDDDGKTWFIDDAKNIPPFDHNGKTAFRAVLFKCQDGKPFVQRLEAFDDDAKAKILENIQAGKPALAAEYQLAAQGMKIKRPGDSKWVKLRDGDASAAIAFGEIMSARCPDGSLNARPVTIEENALP